MGPSYLVGAYAASPSLHHGWNEQREAEFMAALRRSPLVGGLELAYYGCPDRCDPERLYGHLSPAWTYTLTCLPGTMDRLKGDPTFGIASADEAGRRRALAFLAGARAAVQRLHRHAGRAAVRAVVVHSAPRRHAPADAAARDALTRSLSELRGWDWDGAELWLEHCDAYTPRYPAAKGFLSLDDELAALAQSHGAAAVPAGMLLNWGRSAIELRDAEAVPRHIALVRGAGALKGLMYSGVCADDAEYGAWADSHAPFSPQAPSSLLTPERALACLRALGPEPWSCLGVKIQAVAKTLTPIEHAAVATQAAAVLDRCVTAYAGPAPL